MALTKISRSLLDTGISDSSDATAITIDSSERVGIGTSSPSEKLSVTSANNTNSTNIARFASNNDNFGIGIGYSTIRQTNASGVIQFETGGSEVARFDASGNLGIGITNPSALLQLNTPESGNHDAIIISRTTHGTVGTLQNSSGNLTVTSNKALTLGSDPTASFASTASLIKFEVDGSEKMRLESNGKLTLTADAGYIGDDTSGILQLRTHSTAGGWGISARNYTNTTTGYWYLGKQLNGTNIFSMTSDSDSIDLNFLSDERIKMNITDSADVLDKIKQITVKDFDWRTELNGNTKDDTRPRKEYGFIAQNFQDIGLGQYVKELMPTDESNDTLGMDYGNITPILVKAIQEQQAQIEALQSEINLLKGE